MDRIFRNREGAKKWAVALAVVFALVACSASAFGERVTTGNITNDDHTDKDFVNNRMTKTLTETVGGGVYELELTAGGPAGSASELAPVYSVLVLDATSSMGRDDDGDGIDGNSTSRWDVVLAAAKAYADTFFGTNDGREKYLAIVSFGYGARVHVPASLASTYGVTVNGGYSADDITDDDFGGAAKQTSPNVRKPLVMVNDYYIGGYRGDDAYIHAVNHKTADAKYKSLLAGDKTAFFFHQSASGNLTFGSNDATFTTENVDEMLDNISYYSGTNNEAGLLLAKDLLDNVESPYKNVVMVSDGESPATSTFAWLYDRPPLTGVNLDNVYKKTIDSDYVEELRASATYSGSEQTVNFFDGNWHNVETEKKQGERLVTAETMIAKAKAIAGYAGDGDLTVYFDSIPTGDPEWTTTGALDVIEIDGASPPLTFVENVHALLSGLDAYDASRGGYIAADSFTQDDADFWNRAVKSLFWQGGALTKPYGESKSDVSDYSHMPNAKGKNEKITILDYLEASNTTNVYGSDSARRITGESAGRVKAEGCALYYVAVGNDIKNAGALEGYSSNNASTQHFFYVAKQHAVSDENKPGYIGFEMAAHTFEKIAVDNLAPLAGVVIHDTLAEHFTADVANIDKAVITLYYYDADGSTPMEERLTGPELDVARGVYDFGTVNGDSVNIRIEDDTIHASVGTLWDVETAKAWARGELTLPEPPEGTEIKFYFKASVKFPVLVDLEAIGTGNSAPSNEDAYFDYDGGRSPDYISPEIYIPADEDGEDGDEGDGEGEEDEEGNEGDGEGEEDEEGNEGDGEDEEGNGEDENGNEEDEEGGSGNNGGGSGNSGGGDGDGVTPPSSAGNEDADGDEDEDAEEDATANTDTDTDENADESTGGSEESEEPGPSVLLGMPVQPGTPDVPPVPYYPGSSLVPLDDGGFLEIDEEGVPLGVWEYDNDEEAWIFDEEVPLALLPQTGGIMPSAGAAYLWVFPLLALLWLGFVWPRLRRYIGARGR